MFDIKVIDKRIDKVDVDFEACDAVIYIVAKDGNAKSGMLFNCNGEIICTMFAILKSCIKRLSKNYEEIAILDKLGIIDELINKMDESSVTTTVEDDCDTPVIQFPRKD